MSDVKGPAIDPEAFSVEAHGCAIRLPGMKTLKDDGDLFALTPDAREQLIRDGVLSPDAARQEKSQRCQPEADG